MKRESNLWERLMRETIIQEGTLPGQPLIEIAGDHRVLIESHCGVKEYSRERIRVMVRRGSVVITGNCLELRSMTRDQLVIFGCIDGVILKRREHP